MKWAGPKPGDWADKLRTVLAAPVPPERWPWGPPDQHEDPCTLHRGGLFCDCAASDSGADGWGWGVETYADPR